MIVLKPGPLTTVQDLGRPGYRKYGVPVGGAMDTLALRLANLAVGNEEGEAALEITLAGAWLQFREAALICLSGADLGATLDGQPLPMWRPVYVSPGSSIRFSAIRFGCRAYLAVAGGWNISKVLGSRSTYSKAGFGGMEGRPLREGDVLSKGPVTTLIASSLMSSLVKQAGENGMAAVRWSFGPSILRQYMESQVVRSVRGGEYGQFTADSREKLFSEPFIVTKHADRMGYRLKGSRLRLERKAEMMSEAVDFGTVQVPPQGDPIVLMADAQTTGGYPRILQAATVDLPVLAQKKQGERIAFQEVSLAEAQRLLLKRERELAILKRTLHYGGNWGMGNAVD